MSGSVPAQAQRAAPPSARATREVEVVATRRRTALALVLRARLLRPVRTVGGRRHAQERDLPDLHARVDRDREVGDVRQLEGQVPVPACVDESCGAVDEEAETAEARLALEARDEVVGQRDAFERRAEHELAGME